MQDTISAAPNIANFPVSVNDFLNNSKISRENYKEIIARSRIVTSDGENGYPSLDALSGHAGDPAPLLKFIDKIVTRLNVKGRVLLYGAGTLTAKYINYLNGVPHIDVVGILDGNSEKFDKFKGFSVFSPSEHRALVFDYLLVFHFSWEVEMVERALESGIPHHKIIRGITNPDLQEELKATCISAINDICQKWPSKSNVVLTTTASKWSVMNLDDCNHLFPDENTHLLVYSNPGIHYESWERSGRHFIGCPRSRPFLMHLLLGLAPQCVYLKVSPHTNSEWLPMFVRAILPNTKIVVEYYDMAVLFSENFLRERLRYSESDIDQAKVATYDATQKGADFLVVKAGGRLWDRLEKSISTPVGRYFPLISGRGKDHGNDSVEPSHHRLPHNRRLRVIYAGSIPAEELKHGLGSFPGANMFRYLYKITEKQDILVDLYNAGDHENFNIVSDDNLLLRKSFNSGPIRYHTSIPFEDLLKLGDKYDFAFTAVHYPGDFTENVTRSGIGNRFMGYLMAGLPVIVDTYFEYQAELISSFNAGIVIEPERMDELPDMIRQANLLELRAGVQRLLSYMSSENQKTYNKLKILLSN